MGPGPNGLNGNTNQSIFGGIADWLDGGGGNAINNALGLAGSVYSIDQGLAAADRMENLGNYLNDWSFQQGTALDTGSQFKGYGITSNLGSTTGSNTDGRFGMEFGVGPDAAYAQGGDGLLASGGGSMTDAQNQFRNALSAYGNYNAGANVQQAMNRSMADPSGREQEMYNRLMALQAPELDRQQAQQQANEYAMGRGGVRGSLYGGTAEDAAMARARATASREAAVNAMDLAREERGMFADMATQYGQLGNQRAEGIGRIGQAQAELGQNQYGIGMDMEKLSYLPMDMQLQILQQGMTGSEMAQQGQLTGKGFLSQMVLGGMGNNVNAQKVANESRAQLMSAILNNLGGSTGSDGSGLSGLGGVLSGAAGGLDWLYNGLTGGGWSLPSGSGSSDIRLKENIQKVGEENGLNLYPWDWNDKAREIGVDHQIRVGVIAQELGDHPAIGTDRHGYLTVNYSSL